MLRVGLTGGIGAGKSTVARRLAERGAVVVDADRLARAVVEPGTPGLAEIVAAFGPGVLAADGSLDRPALGRIVFADEPARGRLNAITHPRIAALTAQAFAQAGQEAVVVHDVPLLVENRMGARYHLVVVVDAPAPERVRRLVSERGMAEDDAWARVRAQASDDERTAAADVRLDNVGGRDDVREAVDRLWATRLVPFEANVRLRRPAPGDVRLGPSALARLVDRLVLATALAPDALRPEPDRTSPEGVSVQVRDAAQAGDLAAPLADAGFPRRDPVENGGVVHGGADPAAPVVVRLVW